MNTPDTPPRAAELERNVEKLLMKISQLEEQNAGLWEINRKLHEQSGRFENLVRQAIDLIEKNLPPQP